MPTGDGLLARIHPPLGVLSLPQAQAVAQAARDFGNGHIDLTARANLQIRGVTEATGAPLARRLTEAGLGDRRDDGGPQRLTLTSPLAGLDPAELIDVPALARTIEAAALAIPELPAKTLVVVEGRPDVAVPEADCRVVARDATRVAIGLAEDSHAVLGCGVGDAPAVVAALLGAFARTGRRRMRDLSESERVEVIAAACGGGLAVLRASGGFAGHTACFDRIDGRRTFEVEGRHALPPPSAGESGPRRGSGEGSDGAEQSSVLREGRTPSGSRVPLSRPLLTQGPPSPAKAGGRETAPLTSDPESASVASKAPLLNRESADLPRGTAPVAPAAGLEICADHQILTLDAPFGRCTADALDRVVAAARAIGADAIRLSPTRGFVLLAARDAAAATVLAELAADFIVTPDDPRRSVDACTGAPGCASGSTPTLADAAQLADRFRPLAALGHGAHVSGCAKGCARPGPSHLTLVARAGLYGVVIAGAPGDEPAIHLPIEAVLDRLGRAKTVGLSAAFASDTAMTEHGRDGRPA